jgi:hypothetical protein
MCVAGCAPDQVLRGLSVAGYGWATMAVGNQFGYLATSRALSLPIAGRPSLHCAMTGLPGRQGEQSLSTGHGAGLQSSSLYIRGGIVDTRYDVICPECTRLRW